MGATGSVSKSSNESGANDSSIDAGAVPVASAAKASAVFEAAATRATRAAIAPVPVADVDASAGDVGSTTAPDATGATGAEPVALADGVPRVGIGAAADGRPGEDAAGADGEEALAEEPPGGVGRGGGFAAGGGDAAGAGRAGGTVGIAAFEIGLLTVATRGAAPGPAADDVAGRLTPAGEPAVALEGNCVAAESDRAVGELAAGDDALPAAGATLEAPANRALEVVVELTGRVAGPAEAGAGPAGARAPLPGCTEAVGAPTGLAPRSLAALAASPSRDPESETPLSVTAAVREAELVAGGEGALAAGVLGVVPPMPGMPNPAGDVGFPAAAGVGTGVAGDKGAEAGAEADACDGFFTDGAAGADVEACDVAPEEVGADAPLPAEAESVSTGPSGSNN